MDTALGIGFELFTLLVGRQKCAIEDCSRFWSVEHNVSILHFRSLEYSDFLETYLLVENKPFNVWNINVVFEKYLDKTSVGFIHDVCAKLKYGAIKPLWVANWGPVE